MMLFVVHLTLQVFLRKSFGRLHKTHKKERFQRFKQPTLKIENICMHGNFIFLLNIYHKLIVLTFSKVKQV